MYLENKYGINSEDQVTYSQHFIFFITYKWDQ